MGAALREHRHKGAAARRGKPVFLLFVCEALCLASFGFRFGARVHPLSFPLFGLSSVNISKRILTRLRSDPGGA